MKTNFLYILLIFLTAYGDILKRYLPPLTSLAILYGLAAGLLIWISVTRGLKVKRYNQPLTSSEKLICNCITTLSFIYFAESLVNLITVPEVFLSGLTASMYIIIPLWYAIIIIKYCPSFDGILFANLYNLSMIPVNIIGIIQSTISSTFLVNTVYSERGSIIYRNIEGGSFARLPSIYVSADRYSALGLMQVYLAIYLLLDSKLTPRWKFFWIFFNILSGIMAMIIAGARSRLLILIFLIVILVLTLAKSLLYTYPNKSSIRKISVLFVFSCLIFWVFYTFINFQFTTESSSFPVIDFILDSFENGDFQHRIIQAILHSLPNQDVSLFGKGIGYFGDKPTEFGIGAIWVESGLLFGSIKLATFGILIVNFCRFSFKSFLKTEPIRCLLFVFPALVLFLGLLTGITAALELSSGILLSVYMGLIVGFSSRDGLAHSGVIFIPTTMSR